MILTTCDMYKPDTWYQLGTWSQCRIAADGRLHGRAGRLVEYLRCVIGGEAGGLYRASREHHTYHNNTPLCQLASSRRSLES